MRLLLADERDVNPELLPRAKKMAPSTECSSANSQSIREAASRQGWSAVLTSPLTWVGTVSSLWGRVVEWQVVPEAKMILVIGPAVVPLPVLKDAYRFRNPASCAAISALGHRAEVLIYS